MGRDSVRYLSRADVEAVGLAGTDVIEILDLAFRAKRERAVEMPPKIGVHPREDAFMHAMPAYLAAADAAGLKWGAGDPGNEELGLPYIHGLFLLFDAQPRDPVRPPPGARRGARCRPPAAARGDRVEGRADRSRCPGGGHDGR